MAKRGLSFLLFVILLNSQVNAQELPNAILSNLEEINLTSLSDLSVITTISTNPINDLAWSPNMEMLGLSTQNGVQIVNLSDMSVEQVETLEGVVHDIDFVDDNHTLMIRSETDGFVIFDLENETVIDNLSSNTVSVSFTRGIYVEVEPSEIILTDIETKSELQSFEVEQVVDCDFYCDISDMTFSTNGARLVYTSGTEQIQAIINLETYESVVPETLGFWDLTFNFDATLIAGVGGEFGFIADTIFLTNAITGHNITVIELLGASFPTFSKNGDLLVVGGLQELGEALSILNFYNIQDLDNTSDNQNPLRMIPFSETISAIAFSPDYRMLAVGTSNGELFILGVSND